MLTCNRCKELKEPEEFYKDSSSKTGRKGICKACVAKRVEENRVQVTEKKCSTCGEVKAVSEFYRSFSSKDGFRGVCKSCTYKVVKAYDESHREQKNANKRRYAQTLNGKWKAYAQGASKRGLTWELSKEDFKSLWQSPCSYCGDEIKTIGIDRVDSSQGYTVENTVPCCKVCNQMKSNYSEKMFLAHVTKVVNFTNRRE